MVMRINRAKKTATRIKEAKDRYIEPVIASMEEFTLKTAVGVSPALKKKSTYIVSTLF